jgi:hypothetical protein
MNATGCDSTITINLTVNNSSSRQITSSGCSFTLNGITYDSTGIYTQILVGANSIGCDSIITIQFTKNDPIIAEICMVSVDSTGRYNVVYWERSLYPLADSFYVYREISNNNYQVIGIVPADSSGIFVDTVQTTFFPNTGDPSISSYKYKIAILDTCGKLYPKGNYHKTMFLQDQQNGNFNWNHYEIEGTTVPPSSLSSYLFKRDNNLDGIFETIIASTTGNISTDPQYTTYQNSASWRIETDWSITCDPYSRNPSIVKSQSNIVNNSTTTNFTEFSASQFNIYPNPASSIITIEKTGYLGIAEISVYDVLGRKLSSIMPGNNSLIQMEMPQIPGTYYICIEDENGKRELFKVLKI